jgi:toxin YoeB
MNYKLIETDSAELDFYKIKKMSLSVKKKLTALLNSILDTPFEGIGKPEPLRYEYAGYWSRRLTEKHRIIYKVENDTVIILKYLSHYNDK